MKVIQVLYHGDEVSGTWIMGDSTKCFWTEGDSPMVCVFPNDTMIVLSQDDLFNPGEFVQCMNKMGQGYVIPLDAELVDCLVDAIENGVEAEAREMTPDEEKEHDIAMS